MKTFLLTLACLFACDLSIKFGDELLTKDYFIYPKTLAFDQVSLDFKIGKRISRLFSINFVSTVRIKHVGSSIHIYWLERHNYGTMKLTKISRSSKEETLNIDINKPNSRHGVKHINDIDVHPTFDMVYAATSLGLLEVDMKSPSNYKILYPGETALVKLDHKDNKIHFLHCEDVRHHLMTIDYTSADPPVSFDFGKCFDVWAVDTESGAVYLSENRNVYSGKFDSKPTKINEYNFESIVTSLVLQGSDLLVVNRNGEARKISLAGARTVSDIPEFQQPNSVLAIYKGKELEAEPVIKPDTTKPDDNKIDTTPADSGAKQPDIKSDRIKPDTTRPDDNKIDTTPADSGAKQPDIKSDPIKPDTTKPDDNKIDTTPADSGATHLKLPASYAFMGSVILALLAFSNSSKL